MTEEEKKAAVQRGMADARMILKQGADRAAADVVNGLKPLTSKAAHAAQIMVDRGVDPAVAIKAAADVASHQFMMTRLSPVGQDWAALSPSAPIVTLNRLKGEF